MGPENVDTGAGRPGAWRRAVSSAATALFAVALAYQLPSTTVIDFASPLAGALSTRDFYDAEAGYRWSRGRSEILFRAPGKSSRARLELVLSGFRPRGEPPPRVVVETPHGNHPLILTRRIEPYTLDVATSGLVSSDLLVVIRSEVFSPGGGDDRGLGVRVHRAALSTSWGAVPPFKELALAAALAALVCAWIGERRFFRLGSGVLLALAFALSRHWTSMALPWIVGGLAILLAIRTYVPELHAFLADFVTAMRETAVASTPARRDLAIVVSGAVLATVLGYGLRPRVELDLGSGELGPILSRFGALDRGDDGVRFREALAGGTIDLRDFGASGAWTLEVRVAATAVSHGSLAPGVVLTAEGLETRAALGSGWRSVSLELPPGGEEGVWRSGHVLRFPGYGGGARLKVASVSLDRGWTLPSLHAVSMVVASAGLVFLALLATGLRGPVRLAGPFLLIVLVATGLVADPAVTTPFLSTIATGSFLMVLLALASRGLLAALVTRSLVPVLHPLALSVSVLGFLGWFLAAASPLYAGGHFGYHTSIAQEIWQGKFLLYYLPEPENMLARQPQWGNLVVPHSSLFHTLSSPFAALPRLGFYTATKAFLAFLLATIAVTSGLVATACRDERAGALAAAVVAFVPTGYQLLGLGHLMTIFGCAAAAAALGFLVVQAHRLSERPVFWGAAALLTLCFLSYTGSLLFGSAAVAFAAALAWRDDRDFTLTLAKLLVVAWGLALLLYYMNWVRPFLTETLPALGASGGSDEAMDLSARLLAIPRKLSYSFGSALIPVAGLVGVLELERGTRKRRLLLGWALVLVVFTGLDLVFNLLLKHHYFSLPLVAVGLSLSLDALARRSRYALLLVALTLLAVALLGAHEAYLVARGLS